jgi:hypothetical protein
LSNVFITRLDFSTNTLTSNIDALSNNTKQTFDVKGVVMNNLSNVLFDTRTKLLGLIANVTSLGTNVGISQVNPQYPLDVTGTAIATQIVSRNDVSALSDSRLKTNLLKIGDACQKIETLTGYTYNRIEGDAVSDKKFAGVLAQDVLKVLPEVVHQQTDGYLSVSYGNLTALLIEGVKEILADIKWIKSELALRNRG